jgi:hypothetical protein
MYKGERDDYIRIRVPQMLCNPVTLASGDWIEIGIPGKITATTWESWMVRPRQVFWDRSDPDGHNIIDSINDNTDIKISCKTCINGTRSIIKDSEYIISPHELCRLYENL